MASTTNQNQIPQNPAGIDTVPGVNAVIDRNANDVTPIPLSDPTNAMTTVENMLPFGGKELMSPVGLPGPSVQANVVGAPDGPLGGSGAASATDMDLYLKSQIDGINQDFQNNQYAKTFQYDAGPKTNAFYERYAAYGDDKFSEVGFHPFIDNEANFNNNTTMWDDWGRMLQHSFPVLLKRGFIDGPKSLGKAITGDFTGADLEDAEEYEKYAAIGQSSKPGVSAFFNNTVMNFGYTAGIITEAIIEEVALSAMTLGSLGTTSGIQAVRTGQLGANILKSLGKFGSGYKAIKNILPKIAKNPASARTYWNGIKSAAKVINPLENTVGAVRGVVQSKRAYNAGKSASYINGLGAFSKTVGGFYRDIRNVNMAISEARLEAGMVENDIFKELYDDHYNKNKKTPTDQEQVGMRIRAKQGSLETFYGNAGLIYLTNQITFRNVVAPKGGLRNFIKEVRKDLYKVEGKYGTLGKVVYDRSKQAFAFEKNNLMNLAKSWWKQPGYATAKKTLGYFKANISEGIQENLQETIARANIKNYVEAYKTQGVSKSMYARGVNGVTYSAQMGTSGDTYFDELKKEFSAQGFETFMSGFMMGTFAKPLNSAVPFLSAQYNKIYDNAEYQKWKESKTETTEKVVNELNALGSKKGMKELLDNRLFNLGTQETVSEILKNGSKKEALDADIDALVESTRLMRKTNSTNSFIDKLESMLELTDAELADAVQSINPDNAPKYRERISRAIDHFKEMDGLYKQAEDLFPNPVNLNNIEINEETLKDPEVRAQLRLHQAWEESVKNFVYLNASFKDTAKRMEQVYSNYLADTSLATADYGAVKVLFKPQDVRQQLDILRQELEAETADPKRTKYLKEQIVLLEEFEKARIAFDQFYNREEYYNQAQEMLKSEGIENPTEEQVLNKVKESVPNINDQDAQTEINKNLKDAHDKYIKSIADFNDAIIFKSNLDKAYNELVDYYKLKSENRMLATSIDILTDPGQFLDLVTAMEKEIQKVKDQLDKLNRENVDKEVDSVEFEALLNALAKNAPPLYMTQEDSNELRYNKVIPKILYGAQQEKYDEETSEYKAGLELINKYLALKPIKTTSTNPVSKTQMTDEMKEAIEEAERVFAKSNEYANMGKTYLLDGLKYSRVSNVIGKILDEYGYNKTDEVVTLPQSVFNQVFNNSKQNEDGNWVLGEFEFTEDKINTFISGLEAVEKAASIGFNEESLNNLKAELMSVLNSETLASKQAEIDKLQEQLKKASAKNKPVIEEEIKALQESKVQEVTPENVKSIVSDLLPQITYQAGRERGNTLDDLVRDFFDPNVTDIKYDPNKITEAAFNSLFGPEGYLRKLKDLQNAGEIVIYSKDLTIGNKDLLDAEGKDLPAVAGSLDLFIIDNSGNKYIVDLKTGSNQKWLNYTVPNDKSFDYKKFFQNSMQQRAYSNIYFNESGGTDVKAFILPIATTENKDGKVLTAKAPPKNAFRNQDALLTEDPMFIEVPEDFDFKLENGELVNLKDVDAVIPKGEAQQKKKKSKKLSKLQEGLNKKVKRLNEELAKATTVEEKADVIQKFKNNRDSALERGAIVSNQDAAPFEKAELDLNSLGIEIDRYKKGDRINEGTIINIRDIKEPEESLEIDSDFTILEISNVAKPAIIQNGKPTRNATVDAIRKVKTIEQLENDIKSRESLIKALKKLGKDTKFEEEEVVKFKERIKELKGLPAEEEVDFTIDGDVITLGPNQFIVSQVLPENIKGKLIYATPGTGKSTFVMQTLDNNYIDADNIMVSEIEKAGYRAKKLDESPQEYIEEFSFSANNKTGLTKNDLNKKVFSIIEDLLAEGKTVFTGTLKLLADSDIAILGTESHEGVKSRLGTALSSFMSNQSLQLKNFKNKTPFKSEFEEFKIDVETSEDTLDLYDKLNSIKQDLTEKEFTELKEMLDAKATSLLNPQAKNTINTDKIYTFINTLPSKKISSGQEVKVMAIDSQNKRVVIKKAGPGNFKDMTITYDQFIKGINEQKSTSNQSNQDNESASLVDASLNNEDKINSLNNSKKNFENYKNTDEDSDIFGCT